MLWEPFSRSHTGIYRITRNLYKNVLGDNSFLKRPITILVSSLLIHGRPRSVWLCKRSTIAATGNAETTVKILDGIENLPPYGVLAGTQNELSCLVDAYKKNELVLASRPGCLCNEFDPIGQGRTQRGAVSNNRLVVWGTGRKLSRSSSQLSQFRSGLPSKNRKSWDGGAHISFTRHLRRRRC